MKQHDVLLLLGAPDTVIRPNPKAQERFEGHLLRAASQSGPTNKMLHVASLIQDVFTTLITEGQVVTDEHWIYAGGKRRRFMSSEGFVIRFDSEGNVKQFDRPQKGRYAKATENPTTPSSLSAKAAESSR